MKAFKRKKLEEAGWKVDSAAKFLGLNDAEEMLVNMKLSLASQVKERRLQLKMTQQQLAKRLGSSQSRVAKMETGDPSVSLDLLIRSLLALGASEKELAKTISS